jgi:hypothetical protein
VNTQTQRTRKPNTDARGNSYTGERVLYDARTGDRIKVRGTIYTVADTYPNSIGAVRSTPFGEDYNEFGYDELRSLRARFN